MTRHAPLRYLTLIVPMALLMAACGSDDPSASNAAGSSTTEVESAAGPAEVATSGGTDDSADTTSTTPPTTSSATTTEFASAVGQGTGPAPDPGSCLPGTWELRAQEFFDQIVVMAEAAGGGSGSMRHLGGRHVAIFNADGTAEGLREGWSFEVATDEGGLIVTVDATDTGAWAVDGDNITVSSQEQTFEASYEMSVGGVRQPLPFAPPNAVDGNAFGGTGPFTCAGDVLTITLTDAGVTITNTWDRVAG